MDYLNDDCIGTTPIPTHGSIRETLDVYSGALIMQPRPMFNGTDPDDVDFQIHGMAIKAYGAVLRAFSSQSCGLSWDREALISELRKELKVSDAEHREILAKINSDDLVKSLRTRKLCKMQVTTMTSPPFLLNSMHKLPGKRLKQGNHNILSSPNCPPFMPPSPTYLPSLTAYAMDDSLDSSISCIVPHNSVQPALMPTHNRKLFKGKKSRGLLIVQPSKKGRPCQAMKSGSNIVEVHVTNNILHEVERVCARQNPDPAQFQMAKLMLKKQERALVEAIEKLADVSEDGESDYMISFQIEGSIITGCDGKACAQREDPLRRVA